PVAFIPVATFAFTSQWSRHLRSLPSFPSRRSSDLNLPPPADHAEEGIGRAVRVVRQALLRQRHVLEERLPADLEKEGIHRQSFLDRKSTRLNSSHVAISYAVFCLKKKKQQ